MHLISILLSFHIFALRSWMLFEIENLFLYTNVYEVGGFGSLLLLLKIDYHMIGEHPHLDHFAYCFDG